MKRDEGLCVTSESTTAADSRWKRRWRYYLAGQFVVVVLVLGGGWSLLQSDSRNRFAIWSVSLTGAYLVFSLPVCVLYLMGRVHDIDLSPLVSSKASREYLRQLKARPEFSDDEFLRRFFSDTDIPPVIPVAIRRSIRDVFGRVADRVQPDDPLYLLNDDWDLADLLWRVGRELNIKFPRDEYDQWDGTISGLAIWTRQLRS
jgi:hypothetical protein